MQAGKRINCTLLPPPPRRRRLHDITCNQYGFLRSLSHLNICLQTETENCTERERKALKAILEQQRRQVIPAPAEKGGVVDERERGREAGTGSRRTCTQPGPIKIFNYTHHKTKVFSDRWSALVW